MATLSMEPTKETDEAPHAPIFSVWWLVVPTLIYAFLVRNDNILGIVVVTAIAVALRMAQGRSEIPPAFRPYLPLAQSFVVFVFLGGNLLAVLAVGAALVAAVRSRDRLIPALEPWWELQGQLPLQARRVLAFALPFVIGYGFGKFAGGKEWTFTFLSIVVGTVVAFLLLFTPPRSLRQIGVKKSP